MEVKVVDESSQRELSSNPSPIAPTDSLKVQLGQLHIADEDEIGSCLEDDHPEDDSAVDAVVVGNSVHEFYNAGESVLDNSEKLLPQVIQALCETTQFDLIEGKQPWVFSDKKDDFTDSIAKNVFAICSQGHTLNVAISNTKQITWEDFNNVHRNLDCHIASNLANQCALTHFPFDPGAKQLFVKSSLRTTPQSLKPFDYQFRHRLSDVMSIRDILKEVCVPTLIFGTTGRLVSQMEVENLRDTTNVLIWRKLATWIFRNFRSPGVRQHCSLTALLALKVLNWECLLEKWSDARKTSSLIPLSGIIHCWLKFFGGRGSEMPHVHCAQELAVRYAHVDSLYSGSTMWKPDLETFEGMTLAEYFFAPDTIKDLYLTKSLMEHAGAIMTSELYSVAELEGKLMHYEARTASNSLFQFTIMLLGLS